MISIYQFKSRFQQVLRPLLGALVNLGVRANHVTVFAMTSSLGYGLSHVETCVRAATHDLDDVRKTHIPYGEYSMAMAQSRALLRERTLLEEQRT